MNGIISDDKRAALKEVAHDLQDAADALYASASGEELIGSAETMHKAANRIFEIVG